MLKKYRIPLILLLILSPAITILLVSELLYSDSGGSGNMASGIALAFALLFYTPAIAIIGLLTSFFTRKSKDALRWSVLGYAIPAGLLNILLFIP